MSDPPFYTPNRTTALRRQPKPGEPLWSLRLEHVTWSCELRFHGESYGWEAQILRDGELVIGHRFALRAVAQACAEAERQILEKGEA